MKSIAFVPTANASRYLQQLCKHFGHKIETRFDERTGTCVFPNSNVEMVAHADRLEITVAAADEDGLARGRDVVWSHLVRFAFREELAAPQWDIAA